MKFSERVWAVVKRIPRGRVASYGLVAKLAGAPGSARYVGNALRIGHALPWWRVLAKDGRIVIMHPEWHREQHERLLKEGVSFDTKGRVEMARHEWRPAGVKTSKAPTRKSAKKAPARPRRPGSPRR